MNRCSSTLTMVVFPCFPHPMAALCLRHVPLLCAPKTMRKCVINAKLETEKHDLLFQNAMQRASLRLKETLRAGTVIVICMLFHSIFPEYLHASFICQGF